MSAEYSVDDAFDAWVATLPAKHWAKYDISACRLGWEAHALIVSSDNANKARCNVCNGTGEVVALDGEWRGECRACKYHDGKANPPAQAAQAVDVDAIREVIANIEASSLSDDWIAPIQWADKLTRAIGNAQAEE